MAPIQHFAAPAGIATPPLSFAARTGDLLYISGIPGFDDKGSLPDGFEAQFGNVVKNIKRILTEAGGDFRNLVKVNVLLTRASDVAPMNKELLTAIEANKQDGKFCLEAPESQKTEQTWRFGPNNGVGNVFGWLAPPEGKHLKIAWAKHAWPKEVRIEEQLIHDWRYDSHAHCVTLTVPDALKNWNVRLTF